MIEANSQPAAAGPSAQTLSGRDEQTRTRLALLSQLEASLHGSRKALLAGDLAGIEAGTREQRVLAREIEALLRQGGALSGGGREEELRQTGKQVLAAGRLLAALLVRARQRLRVLVNVLAGPSVNYGPMPVDEAIARSRIFRSKADPKPGWEPV